MIRLKMGITQRKEREKEEMRQLILDAALRLFRERGYDGVSLRNIAEAIEYSPGTIYLYYRDKSEIFFALQFEAAAVKRDHLLSVANIKDPWERLVEFGRRYIDFGMRHPDLYDLLFITRAPMESVENQECWQLGLATHSFFVDTVQACVDQRYFKSTDTETIAYTLWCHAHGLVSLFVRERMRMYPEEKRIELAQKSFALVVKMAETL
ncbi:MAG: TetR/AcrR family transcriptional regulator [Saprospirales bacterium]|jgi:AcrR family transcriptional regulator|nr:TetR/AcrR family transcriptional regulator [Saprospirales bacterium]MBK8921159.1 TetR/AcrR family transcriptional regulator [Saprospirales bacterium]